jgi:hypothetical protein
VGSRIIRTELREQTLTSLAGLPLAMSHIMLMKLNGARRALRPGLIWMGATGAVLVIVQVTSILSHPGTGPSASFVGAVLGWLYFFSQVWLLAHLAAYFSLSLKWGALPVSLAILLLANMIGVIFCIGIFVMPIVALTYVTHLRTTIYQRMEQLAAEG